MNMSSQQKNLQTIGTYNIKQIKKLLGVYNKDNYALVLADYHSRDQQYKDELFLWIVRRIDIENEVLYEIIEYLLADGGADINAKTIDSYTALIMASIDDRKEIVELLLARGADINLQNSNGNTALIVASMNDNEESVKLLLDYQDPEYFDEINHKHISKKIRQDIIERVKEKAKELNEDPITLAANAANLDLVELLQNE